MCCWRSKAGWLALSHSAPALLDGPRRLSFMEICIISQATADTVVTCPCTWANFTTSCREKTPPRPQGQRPEPENRGVSDQTSLSGLVVFIDSEIYSSWRTSMFVRDPAAYTSCSSQLAVHGSLIAVVWHRAPFPWYTLSSQRTARLGSCFMNRAQCGITGKAFHTWLFSMFKYKRHLALEGLCASVFLLRYMYHWNV